MKRHFLSAAIALAPIASGLSAQSDAAPAATTLHEYLTRASDFGLSAAILIAQNGEVLMHEAFGPANRATGETLTPGTPLMIGSLAKQFTAAAILHLAQNGRLSVADPVSRFFPDAPPDKAGITVHQLLTHTSGLPYIDDGGLFSNVDRSTFMREILEGPLEFTPGTRHSYSNPGYSLLAGIVEAASGRSYEEYLRAELFAPADMRSTFFLGEAALRSVPQVHSYTGDRDEGALADFPIMDRGVGAGTVITTVSDLHRWVRAVETDAILTSESREAFFSPQVENGQGGWYAYGWNVVPTRVGTTAILHAGDLGGYNSEVRLYPEEGYEVIVASNARIRGRGYRMPILDAVRRALFGEQVVLPPLVSTGSDLSGLTGRYRLSAGGVISVSPTPDATGVRVVPEGQGAFNAAYGIPDGLADAAAATGDLTERVLQLVRAGDQAALDSLYSPSYPADSRQFLTQMMRDAIGSADVRLAGTVQYSPAEASTSIILNDEQELRIEWLGGRMMNVEVRPGPAAARDFRPTGPNRAAAWDPLSGVAVTLEARAEGIAIAGTVAERLDA